MDRKTEGRIKSEVYIHLRLKHKHIIALYHCFEDTEAVYLIMELAGQSLANYIKSQKSGRCSESVMVAYIYGIQHTAYIWHTHTVFGVLYAKIRVFFENKKFQNHIQENTFS